MAISPMDIHHKEFGTVRVGGYNKEEVDSFLDMVADELDRLLHRNQEQSEQVESMRQKASQLDSMQQTLQNALINAQKSADSIVQEARAQAEAMLNEAKEQGARIFEDAQNERSRIAQYYSGIREQVIAYISTIRELMDKNRAMLDEYEARLAGAELREETDTAPRPSPPGAVVTPEPVADLHVQSARAEAVPGAVEPASGEAAAGIPEPRFEEAPARAPEAPPLEREPIAPPFQEATAAGPQAAPGQQAEGFQASPAADRHREPDAAEYRGREKPEPAPEAPGMRAVFSTEQEMELIRESLSQEEHTAATPPGAEPQPSPRPAYEPAAEPDAEPVEPPEAETGEKHFFWE